VPQPDGFLLNYRFGLIVTMPAAILIGYLLSRLPGKATLGASAACVLVLALLSGLILLDIVQNERVDFDVVDRTIYDGTKESGQVAG
jgi:hypothetical protein